MEIVLFVTYLNTSTMNTDGPAGIYIGLGNDWSLLINVTKSP